MSPGTRIRSGRAVAWFAFDVAHAIDLERVPTVLRPERARLVGRRPAPEYVNYAVPPIEVALGERTVALPDGPASAAVSARLFDFGAVSIGLSLPQGGRLADLPARAQALGRADLAAVARRCLEELVADAQPAFSRLGLNDLVEDYYVFELRALDPPLSAEALLRDHAAVLAAAVSLDAGPLSRQQTEECLRDAISYGPDDLVVAEWSAAIVADEAGEDTLAVLEFLNVQLIELRFLDSRLDRALSEFSGEVYRWDSPYRVLRGPRRAAIRALSELTVEVNALSDRVENAVKLAPDVYLARVYRRCAARLGLPTWDRSVQSKLAAVRELTGVLTERAAARRAELLEIAIIALILLEIVLALLGIRGG